MTSLVPHIIPISSGSDYYSSLGLSMTYVRGPQFPSQTGVLHSGHIPNSAALRSSVLISPRWVTFRMIIVQ